MSSNTRIVTFTSLPTPRTLKEQFPLSNKASQYVKETRQRVREIIHGRSTSKLVIVGPCSVHDPEAVLEYAQKLKYFAAARPDLCVLLRVYFEKPRTSVGWAGYTMDPGCDNSFNVVDGLTNTRRLLVQLCEMGVACATEMLSLTLPQYTSDCISFVAIGARTVESQPHRELVSGLSMPCGLKNDSFGSVDVAINAMKAAAVPKGFIGCDDQGNTVGVQTAGNTDTVIILRGSYINGPNYMNAATVAQTLQAHGKSPLVIVDASHGNSGKNIDKQAEIIAYMAAHPEHVAGIMIESFLVDGAQKTPDTYGQSITDPCLSWERTELALRTFK
jgi:3-deoxy-7-phosphoheptulonate synthase